MEQQQPIGSSPHKAAVSSDFRVGEISLIGRHFGFKVFDQEKQPRLEFAYEGRDQAEVARDAMQLVVRHAVLLDGISRR